MTRQLLLCGALLLAAGPALAQETPQTGAPAEWAMPLLGTPVVLWCGWPFLTRGWTSFRTMRLNMFSLIAMGVVAAWLYSMVAVLAPGRALARRSAPCSTWRQRPHL